MAFETPGGSRLFDECLGFGRRNQTLDPRVSASLALPRRRRDRSSAAASTATTAAATTDGRRRDVGRGRGDGIGEVGGVDRHALRHQVRAGSADGPGVELLQRRQRRGRVYGRAHARRFQVTAGGEGKVNSIVQIES